MLEIDDASLAKENKNRKDQIDSMIEESKQEELVCSHFSLHSISHLTCFIIFVTIGQLKEESWRGWRGLRPRCKYFAFHAWRAIRLSRKTTIRNNFLTKPLLAVAILFVQAEIYNLEKAEWTIDKASDQRMVYVPKDTVIEFMKKVSLLSVAVILALLLLYSFFSRHLLINSEKTSKLMFWSNLLPASCDFESF